MKNIFTIISMLFVFTFSVNAADLKVAELNWQSGSMLASIDAFILEKGYGHNVEMIPGGTAATITSMISQGSPNIFSEAWTQTLGDGGKAAINDGTLLLINNEVIVGAGEGFYVPDYIATKYGFSSFEQVLEHPELFPHPEDASKGGVVICPDGWACQGQQQNLFRAHDMESKGWKLINPGSAAGLNSFWDGLVSKEKPAFGYYWSPTVLVGKLGLIQLGWDTPYAGDDNWLNCISKPVDECKAPEVTRMPKAETGTIVTQGLHPEVMIYLSKREMPGDVITSMLVWSDDNQGSASDAAVEFLKSHKKVWTSWVTEEAAEKISSAL